MAKIKTKEVKVEKKKPSFMEVFTGIWMVAITVIFPLFLLNGYQMLLDAKYGFMLVADGILLAGFAIWALVAKKPKEYLTYMKSFADPTTGKWFSNWLKNAFNIWDVFMLVFLFIVIISTLCASPYIYQAIFGNEGRWVGAITLVLWCLTFFVVSRYFIYRTWYIDVFLIGSLLVCGWCISDYFNVDIMGFKNGMKPQYAQIFVSTIGNIDAFSGYAIIPMAVAGVIYIVGNNSIWRKLFYWICFAIAIISMVTCGADNAYIAIAVLLILIPLAATRTKAAIRRCIIVYATVFSAILLVGNWSIKYWEKIIQVNDALVQRIGSMSIIKWMVIGLWILAAVLFVYEVIVKKYAEETPAPKFLHTIWAIIIVLGVIGTIVMVGIANSAPASLPASMDSIKHYLVFSDDWGTWRMYVWKKLMDIYAELPFINKLFGTGPETASIYLYNKYYFDIAIVTGQLFDSPHNEWLQMFFTLGPLGFVAYLCILITPVIMAFKRNVKKYYPIVLAVGFVCICHLGESIVTLMAPIDIPIVFALMALAQSLFRSKE